MRALQLVLVDLKAVSRMTSFAFLGHVQFDKTERAAGILFRRPYAQ